MDSVEPITDSVEPVIDSVEKILNSEESVTDSVEPVINSVQAIEKILNYSFKNKTLLKDVITQSSSSFDRFKFVGEAALPLAITNHIYLAHPTLEPKELCLLRDAIKRNEKYAFVVAKHGLHQFFISNVETEEEIFKPLFDPIYTLDDLRRQPQPVLSLFRWADKHGKRIEIRYTEFIKRKGTIAQVYLDDELLAEGNSNIHRDITKLTAVKRAIRKLLQKGFTVEMVIDEDSLNVGIEDAKEKLLEICNKRKWPNPIYSVEKKVGCAGYVCSTTIETPTEEGTLSIMGDRKTQRKMAENSSATQMIRALTFSLKDDM